MFLGLSGQEPTYAKSCLCTQACSFVCKPLPKNYKFFFLFVMPLLSHVCFVYLLFHVFMDLNGDAFAQPVNMDRLCKYFV